MAMDVGMFLSPIFGWFSTILMMFLYGGIGVAGIFAVLYGLRLSKYVFPVIVMVDLGNGKMGIHSKVKAGWFRSETKFFGLIESAGNRAMMTNDKPPRKVENVSTKDFQEINGKRGLVAQQKADDPTILVPIHRMNVTNEELLNEIAPADYRDASVKIMNRAESELKGGLNKMLSLAAPFVYALMLFICIMIIVSFGNHQIETILKIVQTASSSCTSTTASTATAAASAAAVP